MQRLRQLTFASLECDRKKRRDIFPERMDGPILWTRLEARIAPTCPKGGGKGRQPHPLPVMLRAHCVQLFCNLSDPAMEDRRRFSPENAHLRLPPCRKLTGAAGKAVSAAKTRKLPKSEVS